MTTQTEAERLAEVMELRAEIFKAERLAEVMELRAEIFEQARIIGMGAERELSAMSRVTALEAVNAELLEALQKIEGLTVNRLRTASTLAAECQEIAFTAIAKHQK